MALEELGDLVLNVILSKVGAKNAAILACVNRRLQSSASEEDVWRNFCLHDLDISVPEDPFGNPASSFKEAYKLWKEAFGMYPWSLVKRIKRCWTVLKSWLVLNFPEAASTLMRGASEAEIEEIEDALGVKLPIPTRILYRFCDGQDIPESVSPENEDSPALGLIGGYWFYSYVVNVYLLPLRQILTETKDLIRQLGFVDGSKYIVVAISSFKEKYFFLNCTNGQLYVGTGNLTTEGEMLPSVPDTLIRCVHERKDCQQTDGMLLWLEEHGRRLQSGVVRVRKEGEIRSISLFPELPPLCSTAVTNGVQIRASACFVPELSDLQNDTEKYYFTYSIRMRLLSEGCVLDGIHSNSCQLFWRHWIIRANENIVSDVSDEAVIGMYPLLHPDGDEFVYESCARMPSSPGSIEGAFTFVPGRKKEK
ncbi:F-box protein SKIP16 isoform X2 [Aristolochia californica]|uniref:F-box protein SKIP16 isoform X2 n=1 Tax=Aristolochia californica TaxID=171875 RepID=UPI0035D688D6